MVFSSSEFLFVFLPAVLLLYYNPVIKSRKFRNVFLFLASIAFYAYGEPVFVFLMLAAILLTWLLGLSFRKWPGRRKLLLSVGLLLHISLLFVFKYASFFFRQVGLLIKKDLNVQISLPIGISFFTFQLMSYLIDVYRNKAKAQKNPVCLGLYTALFPQLIAGPIVRYTDIEYEIENRKETKEGITEGTFRFVYGLAKKLLLANYLAVMADNIFMLAEYSDISVLTAWLGIAAYVLQLYFDFSGYSDMAIGLGRIFGFHILENFNYPYSACSVTELWRKWHISLSSWFKDYVYIPLGGNRCEKKLRIRNMFIVWLLTGIWHGANWTYIVWGLYFFLILLLEKETGFRPKSKWPAHLYVMAVFMAGFVFFRSDTISGAVRYLGAMFHLNSNPFSDYIFTSYLSGGWPFLCLGAVLSIPVFPLIRKKVYEKSDRLGAAAESVLVVVLFLLSILTAVSSTYNPFIYFNF